MLKGKELHTKYMRIAEIMVTDEYPSEEDKIFAIAAVCYIAMNKGL